MDLSNFDPNALSIKYNNIFGLPFREEDAKIVLLPVPWEVTVSYNTGTARAPEQIFHASMQVDLYDEDVKEGWKKGFYMRPINRDLLLRSDYLRKEAELYLNYMTEGGELSENKYLQHNLEEINRGCQELNEYIYTTTKSLMEDDKLVGLIGGDHSTAFGYIKALGEKYPDLGILQIDAHCDLRKGYEGFTYSHASVMYNVIREVPQLAKLVQVGVRDFCQEEMAFIEKHQDKIKPFYFKSLQEQLFEGRRWKDLCDEIIDALPQQVYVSFDIDGLDPKLCPHTGTPVMGGFDVVQVFYLIKKVVESGRKIIGFDLSEVSYSQDEWDANVGARVLFKLSNLLVACNDSLRV